MNTPTAVVGQEDTRGPWTFADCGLSSPPELDGKNLMMKTLNTLVAENRDNTITAGSISILVPKVVI